MYNGQRQFSREQLVFVVETMINGCIDHFTNAFHGRVFSGDPNNFQVWTSYLMRTLTPEVRQNPLDYFEQHIRHLSLNLSALYTQLTGDDLSASDAVNLPNVNLTNELKEWADDWAKGRRGIVPEHHPEIDVEMYRADVPNSRQLAERWIDQLHLVYRHTKSHNRSPN
jgi:hypothetical protein